MLQIDLTPLRIPLVSYLFPMGCSLYSFLGTLPESASPMRSEVAAGYNPAAKSQPFYGYPAGTEARSDLNTHPGIFH